MKKPRQGFSLQIKLTLGFLVVSMSAFLLAWLVLPLLHMRGYNRTITESRETGARILRTYLDARLRVNEDDDRRGLKRLQKLLLVHQLPEDLPLSVPDWEDARSWASELDAAMEGVPSASYTYQQRDKLRDLSAMLELLADNYDLVFVTNRSVAPLSEKLVVLREPGTPQSQDFYWPATYQIQKNGYSLTIVFSKHRDETGAYQLEPEVPVADLQSVGLENVSNVFFYTSNEIRDNHSQEFWQEARNQMDQPFFERATQDQLLNQRQIFIPVHQLSQKETLAGLYCIIFQPPPKKFSLQELLSGPTYLAVAIASVLAVLFSYFYARGVTKPVSLLTERATAIAAGDLLQTVDVSSRDEIGVLANAFNEMTLQLRQTLTELQHRAETIEHQKQELDSRYEDLRVLQNYTDNVLRTVDSAIFSVNLSGVVQQPNRAAQNWGFQHDMLIENISSECLREQISTSLETGESMLSEEIFLRGQSGQPIPFALSVSPLREEGGVAGAVVVLTDLQVIKNLEAQISRQERLAALGQLTAGVAHELRNPLSIIKACAEILEKNFGGQPGEDGLLNDIIMEVDRLSRTVSEFLTFARPLEPRLEPFDLNAVIKRLVELEAHNEEHQATIEMELDGDLPTVMADSDQIQQVLLNLVRNAIEAMSGQGEILLRTGLARETRQIWAEVVDQGEGMDEETRRHVFDPFYTSKSTGTGLGLSICHRIMEAQHGKIEVVRTEPGKGSVFRFYLPLICDNFYNDEQQ